MYDELFGWLPQDGIHLTVEEVAVMSQVLRALMHGTERLEPNRAFTVTMILVVGDAVDRAGGGE